MADVAERRMQELRFCVVFALLSVAIFAVIYAAGDVVVSALNRHIAWTAALALRVLGTSAASAGAVVSAGGFAVEEVVLMARKSGRLAAHSLHSMAIR